MTETYVDPWDEEAEQCAVGMCLQAPEAMECAAELLRAEDFYHPRHRTIFGAMRELYARNEPVQASAVHILLRDQGRLDDAGGQIYLSDMKRKAPHHQALPHYAKIVRGKALQRELIALAAQVQVDAAAGGVDVAALIADTEARIQQIEDRASGDRFKGLKLIEKAVENAIRTRKEAEEAGIVKGFRPMLPSLRELLVPWVPSNYIVIGGEASLGKSVLGLQLMMEMVGQGAKALFVSVEMSEDLVCQRLERAYQGWDSATKKLNGFPMMIIDSPEVSPGDIRTIGRRARRQLGGLDVVLVDYMQLLEPGGRYDGDTAAMTAISKGLKREAKALEVALIAISSLNRPSESFAGKAPTLRRFRQSGQIEFDADVAMLLHRPNPEDKTRIDCIIEKQRNGPTGTVPLVFDLGHLWFGDPVESAERETYSAREEWEGRR